MNFTKLAQSIAAELNTTARRVESDIRFYFWTEKLYSAATWDGSTVIAAHDAARVRTWLERRANNDAYARLCAAGSATSGWIPPLHWAPPVAS